MVASFEGRRFFLIGKAAAARNLIKEVLLSLNKVRNMEPPLQPQTSPTVLSCS